MSVPALLVLVTVPDQADAAAIGHALVEERLAACVNLIGPIRSIYRWEGTVADEGEFLLLIKTRPELYTALETRVRALHSYQVAEVIAVPIERGSAPYLQWLAQATGTPGRGSPQ
ncbi:MAG TPA: divalent-cation tolerance protein CutA [Candidatus Binataceae bacterium]|nr:divalent-cation tolerance protein CutA [Candidatus Binataceae bacterium]